MPPNRRMAAAFLLAIVGGSLGYLFLNETSQPSEYLFGGEPLSARELDQVEAAIAQAGLSGHQREGSRIRVPGGEKSVYLAAVADARALPPNFNALLESALNDGGFMESREAKRERLKIAKQQTLAEIIRAMSWVESAYVLYDEQQSSGLQPTRLSTAVVGVMPRPGESLDARRAKKLQELVVHSVAGMKSDNVKVMSLAGEEAGGGDNMDVAMFDDPYYQRRSAFEQSTREKILHVVGFIPGVRVQVNAELDDMVEETQREVMPNARSVPIRKIDRGTQKEQVTQYPAPSATGPSASSVVEDTEQNTTEKTVTKSTETEYIVGQTERIVHRRGFTPKNVRATVAIPREYIAGVWGRRNPVQQSGGSSEPSNVDLKQVQDQVIAEVSNLVEPLLAQLSPGNDLYGATAAQHVKVEVIDTPPMPLIPEATSGEIAIAWIGRWGTTLATLTVALVGLLILRSALRAPVHADASTLRATLAERRDQRRLREKVYPNKPVSGTPLRSQPTVFAPGESIAADDAAEFAETSSAPPAPKVMPTNSMLPRKTVEAVVSDLANISPHNLKLVLDAVDIDILALALVGAEEALVDRVADELPKPASKTFRRHLNQPGPTRLSDVEAAQRAVADVVLRVRAENAPRPINCAA
jgi:flagellar biosynthesis/type III secretory pathway M-ring protein FliF/YscJ